jgi:hypothetical protein
MASPSSAETSEVAILSRVIRPDEDDLPAAAARAILKIDFEEKDRRRMNELARKARAGTLTRKEREAIDNYDRVGHVLALMHSKARRALKKRRDGA